MWEPARFSWAFALVRAFAAGKGEAWAEQFWTSYEAFRWGDHVSAGPTFQYQTLFSQSMTTQTGFLGFRVAFYGGP